MGSNATAVAYHDLSMHGSLNGFHRIFSAAKCDDFPCETDLKYEFSGHVQDSVHILSEEITVDIVQSVAGLMVAGVVSYFSRATIDLGLFLGFDAVRTGG